MNIALCHFRVGETDGVSLEMEKWKKVLEKMGHKVYLLAGSLGEEEGIVIDELHYQHPINNKIVQNGYERMYEYDSVNPFSDQLFQYASQIEDALLKAIDRYELDIIVPNNIWSLGWGLSAGAAFAEAVKKRSIRAVAHHHDFYWERTRYGHPTNAVVTGLLEEVFPPRSNLIRHVTINKIAERELSLRKGIHSQVIPNVFDFDAPLWELDDYNKDFRERLGIKETDILVLQATRITERKAIELAIDVVAAMQSPGLLHHLKKQQLYNGKSFGDEDQIVLVLAGLSEADDRYIPALKKKAAANHVKLIFVNDRIQASRCVQNGDKHYSLWDAYVHADLITYPSILEGWGNQLLEALFAKKPVVIYEYPVYETDIKPLGFQVISLGNSHETGTDGLVQVDNQKVHEAASASIQVLIDPEYRADMVEDNFNIAKKYLSYTALEKLLSKLF
ncbi:glycosyltransferase family 4 protein [Cohnella luojiensis]|uniref:Glycosyltransferase n=1 Tax=Cohnella luojiensis TaxID=652876 RepID=A0A4Y8M2J4_9BACL|nr:glycosyltransferase family 4 protein [Cohnella luojiensis]TFE29518.1 glycosyltransferase [Cohnella luojiensis]